MKRAILIISIISCFRIAAHCQYQSCEQAFYNLQVYTQQVNYNYNNGANWIRMNIFPIYQPPHWQNLNAWYWNQCQYIQNTYYRIAGQCNVSSPPPVKKPAQAPPARELDPTDISNPTDFEEIEVAEEDKDNQIKVPKQAVSRWQPQ